MRIEEQVVIAAPPEVVWDLIADPAALGRLDPVGVIVEADRPGDPPGVRSRYRAMLRVGPPSHRADFLQRLVGWFTEHLSG